MTPAEADALRVVLMVSDGLCEAYQIGLRSQLHVAAEHEDTDAQRRLCEDLDQVQAWRQWIRGVSQRMYSQELSERRRDGRRQERQGRGVRGGGTG